MAVINFHIWGESISYSMVHGRFLHWPIFLNISKFKLTYPYQESVLASLGLSDLIVKMIWPKFSTYLKILDPISIFLCHIHNLHARNLYIARLEHWCYSISRFLLMGMDRLWLGVNWNQIRTFGHVWKFWILFPFFYAISTICILEIYCQDWASVLFYF